MTQAVVRDLQKNRFKMWVILLSMAAVLYAKKENPVITGINTFESKDRHGIIINATEPLEYKITSSQSPPQVLIEFKNVKYGMEGAFVKYIHLPPVYRVEARAMLSGGDKVQIRFDMDRIVDIQVDRNGTNLIFSWVPTAVERERRARARQVNQFDITVSINFKEAELINVLRLIAKQNNLNIIAGEEVVGTVTANLKDVSLGDALDALLKVNNYDWFLKENIIVVKPMDQQLEGELETRIYKLEYVDAGALSAALSNVLSQKGKVQVFSKVLTGGASGGASSGGGAAGGGGGAAGGGALAALAGAAGGGGGAAGGGGGAAGGGTGGSGGSTDILLVSDLHNNFNEIERVIDQLDQPIPQINISVKFIETNLDMNERLGINWNMRASLVGGDQGTAGTFPIGKWKNLSLATLDVLSFTAILDILSSDNQTRLIQEPQVTTAENMMANVSVGTTYPVTVPTAEGGLAGTQPVTFQDQDIQINLSVQPKINEKVFITMSINAVVQALVGFTGPNADRPIISERTTTTQVRVRNGETLLIGGLIFEQEDQSLTKLPLLGNIPLIGGLFRNKSEVTKQRELLIFITPNIVSDTLTQP